MSLLEACKTTFLMQLPDSLGFKSCGDMDHGDVGQEGPAWSLRSRWCILYSDTLWLGKVMAVLQPILFSLLCVEINQKAVCWEVKRGRRSAWRETLDIHAQLIGLSEKCELVFVVHATKETALLL